MAQPKDVPSVVSGVRIIEALEAAAPRHVGAGALASDLKINRSTCYAILATLERHGWAVRAGAAGWTVGPGFLKLTRGVGDQRTAMLQEEVDRLGADLGFTVFAARQRPDGRYVAFVRADGRGLVHVSVELGEAFPFSAPALMQAFHAWSDPEERGRALVRHGLTRFTDETIVDPEELEAELARVRVMGYAVSLQQFNTAQSGIAAPVFDAAGRVDCAICTLAFSTELQHDDVERVGPAVRGAGRRATLRSGGRWIPEEG